MRDALLDVMRLSIEIAVATLAPLLVGIAVQYLRRLNVQLSAEQQAKLEHAVEQVILEVEEWAAQRLKANLAVSSPDKLTRAATGLLQLRPDLSLNQAIELIHAQLPKMGTGATVALRDLEKN